MGMGVGRDAGRGTATGRALDRVRVEERGRAWLRVRLVGFVRLIVAGL